MFIWRFIFCTTEDVYWALALRLEHAALNGLPLYGVSFDYRKCFDNLPHTILLTLAGQLCLHERILAPLPGMYGHLRRRFVFAGALVFNSFPQMAFCRGVHCRFSRSVGSCSSGRVATGLADAYVDDTGATAEKLGTIQGVIDITGEFPKITGQTLHQKKCIFSVQTHMHRLTLAGKLMKRTQVIKALGTHLSTNASDVDLGQSHLNDAVDIARRLAFSRQASARSGHPKRPVRMSRSHHLEARAAGISLCSAPRHLR